ncbi:hypothetical protein [Microbacterium luteum]|uniref:phage major capsid protein n=1 Tax=Microbacterium luteum TaxID=2782167 RepID=UPI001886BF5B|nr:hypothetical protein [Microbacterium luteum]
MASYTYPTGHPSGTLTVDEARLVLGSSAVVARALADIMEMSFIGDYLLQDRLDAAAGGVFYESIESAFAPTESEIVAPGAGYPKVVLPEGTIEAARAVTRGLTTDVTDKKLAERGGSVLSRALRILANTVIRDVDTVTMGVISSVVSSTFASPGGAWDSAGDVVRALTDIRTQRANLGLGIDLNTVVLSPSDYATLIGMFINDGALPREAQNPATTGGVPLNLYGYNWVTSPFYTGSNPLFVDREMLGGMADQTGISPDWTSYGEFGIEAQSDRKTGYDKWTVGARRITVPVVLEPNAGVQITSTGL